MNAIAQYSKADSNGARRLNARKERPTAPESRSSLGESKGACPFCKDTYKLYDIQGNSHDCCCVEDYGLELPGVLREHLSYLLSEDPDSYYEAALLASLECAV
jgi:hypothetical protein